MKSIISKGIVAAGLAASLAVASSAYAMLGDNGIHPYGESAAGVQAERVITIAPDTKGARVMQDEIVKFVDTESGQSFVWGFDTPGWTNFELSKVAPPGFLAGHDLRVYVYEPRED